MADCCSCLLGTSEMSVAECVRKERKSSEGSLTPFFLPNARFAVISGWRERRVHWSVWVGRVFCGHLCDSGSAVT